MRNRNGNEPKKKKKKMVGNESKSLRVSYGEWLIKEELVLMVS